MSAAAGTVPLPEHLASCSCPGAPTRHSTRCRVAREHDATPLRDRPEYALGVRFAAVSWDYPLRLTATVNVEVSIDPLLYIAKHQAEYDSYVLESGYEEWEKPMCFLAQRLTEDCDDMGMAFGSTRHESRVESFVDDVSEFPRWEPGDTEQLHAALEARRTDPNQILFGDAS